MFSHYFFAGHLNQSNNQNVNNNFASPSNTHLLNSPSSDDLRYHGTELVMLYDYKVRMQQKFLAVKACNKASKSYHVYVGAISKIWEP